MNDERIKISIVLGTGRESRFTERAARYVLQIAESLAGIHAEFVDVRSYSLSYTDRDEAHKEVKRWREHARSSDAFVIVAPEYNHGYPGELKILLDSAYDEYARKAVAIVGVSDGGMGGARMVENLKPVLIEFQMAVVATSVYFSRVDEVFDESGALADAAYEGRVKEMLDDLLWWAKALRTARNP